MQTKLPWTSYKEGYEEAIQYMKDRRDGTVTSLVTPFQQMNMATLEGIEWQSMVVIGGRPATGKTAIKDQIVRKAFELNPQTKISVLEFSLEMVGKVTALRSFSSFLGVEYKDLLSVNGNKVPMELIQRCQAYSETMLKHSVSVVQDPPTVKSFGKIVEQYMEQHSYTVAGKKKYEHVIISIDHSLLLLTEHGQSKNDMLYELGATITKLKRKYPIIFLVLSQLNRSIDHPDRQEEGKYGNYVLESDIFGADALLQHADLVIGLNRPGKQNIRYYGPERYIIESKEILVMHHLKARQGQTGLAFYNTDYAKMAIIDIDKPPKQERGF